MRQAVSSREWTYLCNKLALLKLPIHQYHLTLLIHLGTPQPRLQRRLGRLQPPRVEHGRELALGVLVRQLARLQRPPVVQRLAPYPLVPRRLAQDARGAVVRGKPPGTGRGRGRGRGSRGGIEPWSFAGPLGG